MISRMRSSWAGSTKEYRKKTAYASAPPSRLHAADRIVWRARALGGVELARLLVDERQVRERAADVDADPVAHAPSRARATCSSRHQADQKRRRGCPGGASSIASARSGMILPH